MDVHRNDVHVEKSTSGLKYENKRACREDLKANEVRNYIQNFLSENTFCKKEPVSCCLTNNAQQFREPCRVRLTSKCRQRVCVKPYRLKMNYFKI